MIPVNQFILGSSDPLLYPSEKMTNSIDEQIAFLLADKDGMIDIEGIFDEEMEVINNIDNFNFDIPFYLKNGLVVI